MCWSRTQLALVDTSPCRGGVSSAGRVGLAYVGGDQLAVCITLNTGKRPPVVAIWYGLCGEEVTASL